MTSRFIPRKLKKILNNIYMTIHNACKANSAFMDLDPIDSNSIGLLYRQMLIFPTPCIIINTHSCLLSL